MEKDGPEPPTDTSGAAQGNNEPNSEVAVACAASSPTTAAPKKEGVATEIVSRKRWGILPSFSSFQFSFPILKILQGIFLVLMIGQSLPGAEKSFWPFNKLNNALDSGTKTDPVTTPFYAEMRSDGYGDERQFPKAHQPVNGGLMALLFGSDPDNEAPKIAVNTGIPALQHIALKHLNREYEAYRFSVQAATTSKIQAGREFGQSSFRRVSEKVLLRLTDLQDRHRLTVLEQRFIQEGGRLVNKLATLRSLLVDKGNTRLTSLPQCNNTNASKAVVLLPHWQTPSREKQRVCGVPLNMTDLPSTNKDDSYLEKKITRANNDTITTLLANFTLPEIKKVEAESHVLFEKFLRQISEQLSPGPAHAIKDGLRGHYSIWGFKALIDDLRKAPMRTLFSDAGKRKRLFLTYFVGDMFASTVGVLRKEVTAIVRSAKPGDEALVVLQSGGGTVTGYGLVAAQLLRIKEAGLTLTIAVEQVAASGGYMAACVGDTIVCSPFAVVGSIGVVQDMPNIHERLKREGIEFHQIIGGEYKRVLSSTKEIQPEDLRKAKDEVDEVWTLFKDFVAEQRPVLNIDVVATGETWYGKRALELGLCDALQTADDVLIGFMDRGYDVYHVKYEEPVTNIWDQFLEFRKTSTSIGDTRLLGWILQKVVAQLQVELGKIGIGIQNNNRPLLV